MQESETDPEAMTGSETARQEEEEKEEGGGEGGADCGMSLLNCQTENWFFKSNNSNFSSTSQLIVLSYPTDKYAQLGKNYLPKECAE